MKKIITYSLFLFLIIWMISFLLFAFSINKIKISDEKTDAIVVLTGGANRIDEALRLLKEDKSDILLISGVYKDTSMKSISPIEIPKKNVVLGKVATNTFENAKETYEFVQKNNIKSIRLVTSSYHMKRSVLEHKTFVPDVKIIPHPVYSNNFKHEDWWKWPGTAWLLISEHNKYYLTKLRNFIFSTFGINYSKINSL